MTEKEAVNSGFSLGVVKWFDVDKGYGFIVDDTGPPDIFCHATVFSKAAIVPVDGMRIAFKSRQGPKGLAAIELAVVGR